MMTVCLFMVHFKLDCLRDNVLMRHKNCRELGISYIVMGRVGHTGHEWWVTWVMGHKLWRIVSSGM